ncbi:MAG: hypothetical protein IJT95_01575 [Abditibacteriota bacterium]|nr:hypothetical protein [Abditibacteriota bacterium]
MFLCILLFAALFCSARARASESGEALEAYVRRLRAMLGASALAGSLSPGRRLLSPESRRDMEDSLARAEECLSLISAEPGPEEWKRAALLADKLADFPQRRALAAYCRERAALLRRERRRQARRARAEAFAAAARRFGWLILIPAFLAVCIWGISRMARRTGRERTRETVTERREIYSEDTEEDTFWYTPEDGQETESDRYREAVTLYEDGDYGEAMDIFEELDGYKNSDELSESARRRLEREDDFYYEPEPDELYDDGDDFFDDLTEDGLY